MAFKTRVSTGDRLSFAFFVALALHLFILLQLGFKIPSADKIAPTLNITLATHISQETPEKADFLAQHNQEASGSAEQVQELLTNTQADFNDTQIREIMPDAQQQSKQAAELKTEILQTEAQSRLVFEENLITEENPEEEAIEAQDEDIPFTNPEAAALQAKLDKLRQSEALRPKVKRIQTEATKASKDAAYLHAWNSRVEMVGNQNFPEEAITQELYGTLMMVVTLNADGTVADAEILSPSDHPILNQSALQMVHLAAPYERIPPEVLDGADKLEITRVWSFEITGLSTTSAQ